MSEDTNKRRAATAALSYIKDGMALGVGTGSTIDIFIELLATACGEARPRRLELGAIHAALGRVRHSRGRSQLYG